jgi:polysaccharide deacetylase family protein (PEP-CTERM system associated)
MYHAAMSPIFNNMLPDRKCLLSIDVEDWYHILDLPSAPKMENWSAQPARVENNFMRLLEILEENRVKATCFFLGWIAGQFPHLVRSAVAAGHEVASHGYAHRLIYQMTRREFLDDAVKTRKILEDISGITVTGYRAPGFSVTESTPWFFDALHEAGYRYDSSIFPATRGHGGFKTDRLSPYIQMVESSSVIEIPVSVERFWGRPTCFFGGGYLRLFPYAIIKKKAHKILDQGLPVTFYIHPREIDPKQPRLPMNHLRRFKSYVNLAGTEAKLRRLINDFDWTRYCDYIEKNFSAGGKG